MNSNDNKIFKICVSSAKGSLDSEIDPRFGRCKYFAVVEINNGEILNSQIIENTGASQGSGAGLSAAEQIGNLKVKALITGDIGPKAGEVLSQLGIEVYKKSGIIKEAINEYINNNLAENKENTLSSGTKENNNISVDRPRIFVPLMDDNGEDSEISLHFGHAPFFGLYDASVKKLTIKENKLDHSDLSKSPVDQVIEAVDPTIIFVQDMGRRAVDLFTAKNILLKTGPYKTVGEMINNVDKLEDLTKNCGH